MMLQGGVGLCRSSDPIQQFPSAAKGSTRVVVSPYALHAAARCTKALSCYYMCVCVRVCVRVMQYQHHTRIANPRSPARSRGYHTLAPHNHTAD
eukprot:1143069-Pelagomonas_calceolata.AAC.3